MYVTESCTSFCTRPIGLHAHSVCGAFNQSLKKMDHTPKFSGSIIISFFDSRKVKVYLPLCVVSLWPRRASASAGQVRILKGNERRPEQLLMSRQRQHQQKQQHLLCVRPPALVTAYMSSKHACLWLKTGVCMHLDRRLYLVETSDSVNLPHVLARRSTNSLLCLISSTPLRPCIPTTIITTSVPCSRWLRSVVVFPGEMSRVFPRATWRVSEDDVAGFRGRRRGFPSAIS